MLSDNDREVIATGVTFITGVALAALGVISTLHYGPVKTLMLCGLSFGLFTMGAGMAHTVTRPLRRRTTTTTTTTAANDDSEE